MFSGGCWGKPPEYYFGTEELSFSAAKDVGCWCITSESLPGKAILIHELIDGVIQTPRPLLDGGQFYRNIPVPELPIGLMVVTVIQLFSLPNPAFLTPSHGYSRDNSPINLLHANLRISMFVSLENHTIWCPKSFVRGQL